MLLSSDIDKSIITVFCVPEELSLYRSAFPFVNVIAGVRGVVQQRQFIENYYNDGDNVVFIDDDVKTIDLSLSPYKSLDEFFNAAFVECIHAGAYIWGVYPVYNPYFREKQKDITNCLNHIVGCCYGLRIRHLPELMTTIAKCAKEDLERSIRYFDKDGRVLRFNRIAYDTKYYNPKGGIGSNKQQRLQSNKDDAIALSEVFPHYGKIRIRTDGTYEFKLNKIPALTSTMADEMQVTVLPTIDAEEFSALYGLLCDMRHPMKQGDSNRRGFPPHRASVFGVTKYRMTNNVGLSSISKSRPDVYGELIRIGKLVCPFPFTAIHVNHNVTCPPHKDDTNVGKSVLLSIGEYTGSKIVVNGTEYDAFCQPVMFNGALCEHYNTDDLVGNKFSIVYYNSPYAERLGITQI